MYLQVMCSPFKTKLTFLIVGLAFYSKLLLACIFYNSMEQYSSIMSSSICVIVSPHERS